MSDFVNLLINNYRIDRYCIVIAYEYIILDILYLFKHSVKEKPLFVHIFVLFSGNIYGGCIITDTAPLRLLAVFAPFRKTQAHSVFPRRASSSARILCRFSPVKS